MCVVLLSRRSSELEFLVVTCEILSRLYRKAGEEGCIRALQIEISRLQVWLFPSVPHISL